MKSCLLVFLAPFVEIHRSRLAFRNMTSNPPFSLRSFLDLDIASNFALKNQQSFKRSVVYLTVGNMKKKSSSASNSASNEIKMDTSTPATLLLSGENLVIANPDRFLSESPQFLISIAIFTRSEVTC